MEIFKFTPELHGKLISYKHGENPVGKARIYYKNGEFWIIQDTYDGGHSFIVKESNTLFKDKFKVGWGMSNGGEKKFKDYNITNMFLLDSEPIYEIY